MSFGQQSGPPASRKQIASLLALFEAAGYDFATGRHHFGLTQRQSHGKFTVAEASELIDRLTSEADIAGADASVDATPAARRQGNHDRDAARLRDIPAEVLADELESRGWAVIPPG